MFEVRVRSEFSAAHSLRHYKGKCEALHGHNWKVEAVAQGSELNKPGMLVDFTELKYVLKKSLEKIDHKHLNTLPYFRKVNPTSENIAVYIYRHLKSRIPSLKSVTVWESTNSSATYYEQE